MSEELKTIVREKYTEVATKKVSCCSPSSSPGGIDFSEDYKQQEGYLNDADLNLGCGIPTAFARIKAGDMVLDLGCGAGNDVFVAQKLTGDQGYVIGIDMTEAMIAKAKNNKEKLGLTNVEFRLGDIEDMPVDSSTIDVAISNCVMNLVPDKAKAYSELFRVLKPGGHFSISDIVLKGELPDAIRDAATLYAGCVSGAMQMEDYLLAIREAGFTDVEVQKERLLEVPDEVLLKHASPAEVQGFRESKASIYSINVFARKC
ncbi:MAG: arsenite methyltransferase [Mameliella sp.]|nr:arsenite methyltransferase [Phaeodactylibacter sp.]